MSKDLTRWNRAGLRRFRYVDGNAVTYLERLRCTLAQRLPAWTDLAISPELGQSEEDRLLTQYHGERRDFGWEIARTLARSVHVLTEHLDAYANEGYLRTATQWDNVRRLVEMLDYHPAPPASASGYIALLAKSGKSGTVKAGFQVKNKPEDGSAPLIFETLEDLAIGDTLNSVRCKDWNRSQDVLVWEAQSNQSVLYQGLFPLSKLPEDVSKGTQGVLLFESSANATRSLAVVVSKVQSDGLLLQGLALPTGVSQPKLSDIRLLLGPQVIQKPRIQGHNVIEFEAVHGLTRYDEIAWQESGSWRAARVTQVDNKRAVLTGSMLPPVGVQVYPLLTATRQNVAGSYQLALPSAADRGAATVWKYDLSVVSASDIQPDSDYPYDRVTKAGINTVLYLAKSTPTAGRVAARDLTEIVMDGDPGNLASGQWALLAHASGASDACEITGLEQTDDSYTLHFDSGSATAVTLLHADFTNDIRPDGYDRNLSPIWHPSQVVAKSSVLPLDSLPVGLERGRMLIVQGASSAEAVTVSSVDEDQAIIVVTPRLSGDSSGATTDDFTRYSTVIYGNVVSCGHGDTKPGKILGSGDATKSHQTFLLEVENLSFVTDSTQSTGMAAAIEVSVDGRTWRQVATLNDSEPTDHHYTIRMTQEGHVEIGFGDGVHGRRLPTGKSNVRALYRVGSGSAGNLSKSSLSKVAKPNPLVDKVLQPLAMSGGGDMESVASLRDNAPASVLALERAVSLSDFAHLASRHSSVWQARAFSNATGSARHEIVDLVVVPSGGGELTQSLKDNLESYLEAAAVPGVQVLARAYEPVYLQLDITLRIDSTAYEPEAVMASVDLALSKALALKNALLGRALYRSSLYEIVESVAGVENSVVSINEATITGASTPRRVARGGDGEIRAVFLYQGQVLYIDSDSSIIKLAYEEFTL